jgi:hypothetical protein
MFAAYLPDLYLWQEKVFNGQIYKLQKKNPFLGVYEFWSTDNALLFSVDIISR